MEAAMNDELSTELQALARRKGYRLSRTAGTAARYFLIALDGGMPAMNPEDDTPIFHRATALQFLLESPDAPHEPADIHPASGKAA
jgi:hypothetical protein